MPAKSRAEAFMRIPVASLLLVSSMAVSTVSAQVPIGGEFLVNTATADDQYLTSAAMDAAGRFVVVWTDSYQYFHDPPFPFFQTICRGVYGRGFTPSGRPYGAQFGVATGTTPGACHGSIAADGQDRFVVTWDHGGAIDARRLAPDGTPAGAPVRVTGTSGGAVSDVAADPAGRFVVAWRQASDQSAAPVRARRFAETDAPAGDAFDVGLYPRSTAAFPSVATDAAGGFVIAWEGPPSQTSEEPRIVARVFDPGGDARTPPFVVTAYTGQFPAVARTGDGRFIVAWAQPQYGGFQPGVFARVYEADGSPVAGPFQVNATTTGRFFTVSAAADGPASFVVAWDEGPRLDDEPPRPHWSNVFARRFDTAGTALSGAIQVNSETAHGHSSWPEVSSDGQGHFLVAWTRYAAGADVMARRFAPEVIFADRFEWGNLSAWSTSAGGADLFTSPEAAMGGSSLGLHGSVNDTQPLFVQDGSPRGEHRYRARFYFDPGDFDPGEAQGHFRTRLFIGFEEEPEQRRLFAVVLRRRGGEYALMARARGDDNAQLDTGFVPITAGPYAVEIAWTRSSGVDTGDGSLELWVDGALAGSVAAVDNDRSVLDFVRLGALSVKPGASGTLYWDEFESRRATAVGP